MHNDGPDTLPHLAMWAGTNIGALKEGKRIFFGIFGEDCNIEKRTVYTVQNIEERLRTTPLNQKMIDLQIGPQSLRIERKLLWRMLNDSKRELARIS